ncbi:N-acetylmuramoyl-L-alanine amidase [Leuconostocaceae bacterium ESL0723]|nr:N-acetylmuramoyl-L-alanine amidase [Lactobacillaceae bacterium L1_55_11]WEV55106.1 N-acetylmuramoyl-L-alanine amidase [Leuconostocaceae bacterium ESL0723]
MTKWIQNNRTGIILATGLVLSAFILILSLMNQNQLTTRPDQVPLRTGPSITATKEASLKQGTKLIVLDRQHGWWKVRRNDNNQTGWVASWVANNTHLKKPTALSEATIVLDPGHGGSDTGALSTDQKHYEKTYTLETARATAKALAPTGARVVMVRNSDVVVPLLYIPRKADSLKADAQISFHFDSSDKNNTASGISQYYYNENSLPLVKSLNSSLNNLPLDNRGYETIPYLVIKDVTRPAVLLELGFINSDKDFKYIRQSSYQDKVAQDIKEGLTKYVTQAESHT